MGFVLVEEREVAGTRGARQSVPHRQAKTSPTWARTTDIARKATGLALVIAAHILAIGILQLIQADTQSESDTTAMIVTNIPLRPPTKDMQAEAPQPQEEPAPRPETSSEPTEWFKAKIQIPAEPSAPTIPTAQTGAPVKPIALPSAPSTPSTSGYDPYAGVAPLRQSAGPQMATPVPGNGVLQSTDLELGKVTRQRLENALRKRAGYDRGSARFSATVATNGAVVQIKMDSTTLSDSARILLIEETRKLRFAPGPERTIRGVVDLS